MNKEKILNATASLKVKYRRCIYLGLGTTLATAIMQSTIPISINSAFATDGILDVSPFQKMNPASATDGILDISPLQKLTTEADLSDIPFEVASSSKMMPEKDKEFIKPEISSAKQLTPIRRIAQTDSSGVVGDSLGEINKLRQQLLIDPIFIEGRPVGQAAPASSAGTPTGYGASWRQAYVGVGGYVPFDGDNIDGSASVGFGLGDAVKSIGAEISVNVTSLGGQNFDFGESGGIGLKLHKYFADGTAVAVGWSNPVKWGEVNNARDTFYGVVTKPFYLQPNNQLPLTVSLGLGTGSFRSKGAIEADENPINFFGSVGLRVAPQVSVVSSWTGNSLNVGGSFTPLRQTPIVINAIFTDVTNNLEQASGLSLSAGYVFQF
ncbi:hypothetical protein [Mastigocladopsis repens]|uniref:hypothetical protein n=1 Tax=Mastigocladopsis repens TaxID=221287 RepID=UPI000312A9BA|nr:hypothetical protein [Mastigocladopsis repens]